MPYHQGLLDPNIFQRGGLLPFGLSRARGLLSRNVSPDAGATTAPNWYGGLLPPFPKDRTGMTDPLDPLIGLPTGEGSGLQFPPEVLAQLDREQANVREMVRINSLTPGQPKHSVMEIAGAQPTMTRLLPGMMFGAGITPYVGRLAGALGKMPQEKMTAKQAEGYLGKTPGGVSADELTYTGVRGLLEEGRPVTRTGLLEQVKAQPLELRDVVKGKAGKPTVADDTILAEAGLRPEVGPGGEVGFFDDAHDLWMLDEIQANPRFSDAVVGAAERIETGRMGGGAKFSEWQLPGGKNYQETLITMPSSAAIKKQADALGKSVEDVSNMDVLGLIEGRVAYPRTPILDRQAALYERARTQQDFTGGHYDEPNVLAHARHNERTLTNGDKTLFIEEIQSDWHQKGRKRGYQGADEQWSVYDLNKAPEEPGAVVARYATESEAAAHAGRSKNLDHDKSLGVPDAPFKKNWHDLTFRRMAHEAAKRDMDTISWTPGQVQADRYDLSKHLDNINYTKQADGTYAIVAYKNHAEVLKKTVDESGLSELVGKDVAKKMVDNEGAKTLGYPDGTFQRKLSNIDLKVGGEGMKDFYDKMIRKSADKLGKKYGVKAEVREIKTKETPYDYDPEIASQTTHKVWSLPLTPELKKALLKGGVTFGVAAAAMDQDNETWGF